MAAMSLWNDFKNNSSTPKDRRLLLITQPTGTPGGRDAPIYDVVVGHWSSHHGGFVQAIAPRERQPSSTLRVIRWAHVDTPADLSLRTLDGLQ
jgi:hypothetical protein